MNSAIVVIVLYIVVVLGCVWWWFGSDAKRAPKWLVDDAPHSKYDEMD